MSHLYGGKHGFAAPVSNNEYFSGNKLSIESVSTLISSKSYGKDHPDIARDLNNLAQLLKATNRLAKAEPLMRRVVEIVLQFTRTTGHQHPHLMVAINNYAGLIKDIGQSPEKIRNTLEALLRQFGLSLGRG